MFIEVPQGAYSDRFGWDGAPIAAATMTAEK
jgi:hypothetical protein